jgi:hypothetical protein
MHCPPWNFPEPILRFESHRTFPEEEYDFMEVYQIAGGLLEHVGGDSGGCMHGLPSCTLSNHLRPSPRLAAVFILLILSCRKPGCINVS